MRLNLAQYCTGFLEIFRPDRAELRGSGTLVRVGKTFGILTAAHVWRAIRALPEVGIYLYSARQREIFSVTEDMRLLDAVTRESASEDEFGPDIAFVRLTENKAATIEKYSTFLSLEKDEQKAKAGAPENSVIVDAVMGGVEELGQTINMYEDRKLIVQNALLHVGHTRGIEDGRDGFDRLEFTPEPGPEFVPLRSYGGMSGGGCFRVYLPADAGFQVEPIAFHLLGVAFYETTMDGKADKIICHGPVSMRQKLLPAVREKWPSEA